MKRLLILLAIAMLFSCSQKLKLPELDENKFGRIIGVWEKHKDHDEDNSKYYAFTNKLYWLEYWPSESNNWKNLDKKEKPDLVLVGENTYSLDFLWNGDWKTEWQGLTAAEKKEYGNIDNLRKESVLYYVITKEGDLAVGAYATFKNAQSKLTIHKKVEYN